VLEVGSKSPRSAAPGRHVEAEAGGARRERGLQVGEKLVALRGQARRVAFESQARGEFDGASIPGVCPEIVPVGIRRLVGIAFVADRRGIKPK
jgi:hypothetical protein